MKKEKTKNKIRKEKLAIRTMTLDFFIFNRSHIISKRTFESILFAFQYKNPQSTHMCEFDACGYAC